MAISANTILADLQLQHHVQLQRLSSYEYQQVLKILEQLSKELAAKTVLIDPTAPMRVRYRNERTKKLMDEGRRLIGEKFTEMLEGFQGDMYELAEISSRFAINAMNQAAGMVLFEYTLTSHQLKSVVNSTYINGGLLKDWFSRSAESYRIGFQREVQAGMVAGEGIDKIVRRLIGNKREFPGDKSLYDEQKRGTEALVRTAVMQVSNEARMTSFKENEEALKGYKWMATLDSRICPVCAVLDGKVWDTKGKPAGHKFEYTSPPRHWQCRCVLSPVLRSWKELGLPFDRISEGTRASMDGQVPESWTLEEWVSRKREADRAEIMGRIFGPGRYEMYESGAITLDDLVTQKGRLLTLEELRGRM